MQTFRGVVLGSEWIRSHIMVDAGVLHGDFSKPQTASYTAVTWMVPTTIRRCLLYFDRIDWPLTPIPGGQNNPDYEVLRQQKILSGGPVPLPPEFQADIEANKMMHAWAFQQLEKRDPGCWSFCHFHPDQEFYYPPGRIYLPGGAVDLRGVERELLSALPVPADHAAFEDILNFKAKSAAELQAMRAYLDEIYLAIVDSKDVPRARVAGIARLEHAINDLSKAMASRGLRSRFASQAVDLVVDLPKDFLAAVKAAEWAGADTTVTIAIGGVSTVIKFARKVIRAPVQRSGTLAYLEKAADDGVVHLPGSKAS